MEFDGDGGDIGAPAIAGGTGDKDNDCPQGDVG